MEFRDVHPRIELPTQLVGVLPAGCRWAETDPKSNRSILQAMLDIPDKQKGGWQCVAVHCSAWQCGMLNDCRSWSRFVHHVQAAIKSTNGNHEAHSTTSNT